MTTDTCLHGVTLGLRCFECTRGETLPLTMPDQMTRDLAEAREKLAALELLAKLRAHPGFARLVRDLREEELLHASCVGQDDYHKAFELLLELLGGA